MLFLQLLSWVSAQSCPRVTVRKEIHDLTPREWEIFTSTIRRAALEPSGSVPGRTIWEEFAEFHSRMAVQAHGNCQFLPWHRLFLAYSERRLQQLNPEFAWVYWDSSREWDRANQSIIWQHMGTYSNTGLTDGPLANITFSSTVLRPLIRNMTLENFGYLPSAELFAQAYQQSVANGGFSWYALQMEMLHGIVHVQVGGFLGQMNTHWSPLDPIFWMHHGHIDWTWMNAQAGWRSQGLNDSFQMGGWRHDNTTCTLTSPLDGFTTGQIVADVMDPANLCVRYALPGEIVTPTAAPASATSATPSATATAASSLRDEEGDRNESHILAIPEPQENDKSVAGTARIRINGKIVTVSNHRSSLTGDDTPPLTTSFLLPENYTKVNNCPDINQEWFLRNFRNNPQAASMRSTIQSECQDLVEKGSNATMPLFVDDVSSRGSLMII